MHLCAAHSAQKYRQNEPAPSSPKGPLYRRRPIHRDISKKTHLSVSPVKEPYLKVRFMESLAERCPNTTALLHSSNKPLGIRDPRQIPVSPQMERIPHGERCPYPQIFLTFWRRNYYFYFSTPCI